MNDVRHDTQKTRADIECIRIDKWLSPADPSTNYNEAREKHHGTSGGWCLNMKSYAEWKAGLRSTMWLHGISGCGKTILSSTIIADLEGLQSSQPMVYFYFDFRDNAKQTLENMIRSLIYQLYAQQENWGSLDRLFQSCRDGKTQPSCRKLCECFCDMIQQDEKIWIVLDGLDECTTRGNSDWQKGLLAWMQYMHSFEKANVHLLVTSRPEQDIEVHLEKWIRIQDQIELEETKITGDIGAYVEYRTKQNAFQRWRERPELLEDIRATVLSRASGM